ncbi:hypothetical protein MSAN_01899300 [Mycena sanguinolenta]|uniref:Uncharacterized protein n=1 Tax=Mycena sanguinolenta TaxID=230812 RepID=A0A8H6XQE4_9AGAR|nr:hypothetical protein MSAN_01899300 [Mycena sanguinolenta]
MITYIISVLAMALAFEEDTLYAAKSVTVFQLPALAGVRPFFHARTFARRARPRRPAQAGPPKFIFAPRAVHLRSKFAYTPLSGVASGIDASTREKPYAPTMVWPDPHSMSADSASSAYRCHVAAPLLCVFIFIAHPTRRLRRLSAHPQPYSLSFFTPSSLRIVAMRSGFLELILPRLYTPSLPLSCPLHRCRVYLAHHLRRFYMPHASCTTHQPSVVVAIRDRGAARASRSSRSPSAATATFSWDRDAGSAGDIIKCARAIDPASFSFHPASFGLPRLRISCVRRRRSEKPDA